MFRLKLSLFICQLVSALSLSSNQVNLSNNNALPSDMRGVADKPVQLFDAYGSSAKVKAGLTPPANYRAITAWGVVCLAADAPTESTTRVELGDVQLLFLRDASSEWQVIQQSAPVSGKDYTNFDTNANIPSDAINSVGGRTSVTIRTGSCFHFVPPGGMVISDLANLRAILVRYRARVVRSSSTKPNSLPSALMDAGADYWMSNRSSWESFQTNREVGRSRFKLIGFEWTECYFTTASLELISQVPLPRW